MDSLGVKIHPVLFLRRLNFIVDCWDTKWLITTSLTGGTFVLSFVICIRLCLRYVNKWNNSINTGTFCVVILTLNKQGAFASLTEVLA